MTYNFNAAHNLKEILGWVLTSACGIKRGKRVTFINVANCQMGEPTLVPRAAWRMLWKQERNTKYYSYQGGDLVR